MDFYVYVHRRKTDGTVFYVGKGSKYRAAAKHNRSPHWRNIVSKHGYTVEIVHRFSEEQNSLDMERELIAHYGRENLCNMTDGGEGSSGYSHTDESKIKIGLASMGNTNTRGRKHSEETKRKIGLSLKGTVFSDERRKNISISLMGHPVSDESRKKMSIAGKGKIVSQEARDKISIANSGKPKPPGFSDNLRKIMTDRMGVQVACSNGMIFASKCAARDWLISIGKTKASVSNISKCLDGEIKSAYGYAWSLVKC